MVSGERRRRGRCVVIGEWGVVGGAVGGRSGGFIDAATGNANRPQWELATARVEVSFCIYN